MTDIVKSFHTHAEGEKFGWWGSATHPVHLDENGKIIKDTEWTLHISHAKNLKDAVKSMEASIKIIQEKHPGH